MGGAGGNSLMGGGNSLMGGGNSLMGGGNSLFAPTSSAMAFGGTMSMLSLGEGASPQSVLMNSQTHAPNMQNGAPFCSPPAKLSCFCCGCGRFCFALWSTVCSSIRLKHVRTNAGCNPAYMTWNGGGMPAPSSVPGSKGVHRTTSGPVADRRVRRHNKMRSLHARSDRHSHRYPNTLSPELAALIGRTSKNGRDKEKETPRDNKEKDREGQLSTRTMDSPAKVQLTTRKLVVTNSAWC